MSSIAVWNPPCTNTRSPSTIQAGACSMALQRALAQRRGSLGQRLRQRRIDPDGLAAQRTPELAVVVAQQEDATAFLHQAQRHLQRAGAVGAAIGQVAKLHHEAVGVGGEGEGAGIAMHIPDHAQRAVRRDDHAARMARKAASARSRPSSSATMGWG